MQCVTTQIAFRFQHDFVLYAGTVEVRGEPGEYWDYGNVTLATALAFRGGEVLEPGDVLELMLKEPRRQMFRAAAAAAWCEACSKVAAKAARHLKTT